MTSPVIATVGATGAATTTTTTITMPASIAAGDLLLAFLFADAAIGDATWPGDWTPLPGIKQTSSGLMNQLAYKYASGSETNFNLAHSSCVTRARCYRITGHAGSTRPPLARAWQGANAAGPNPVSPHEWKQPQDILSILAATWENTTPSGGVTGYTNEFNAGSGTLGARCEQQALSSFSGTEDPVNYTTGSGNRAGWTVLIASDNGDPDLTFPIVRNWFGGFNGGNSAGAANSTVPVVLSPQREVGDVLMVAIGLIVNVTISSGIPSGWATDVSVAGGGAGGERMYVLTKRCDGSEVDFSLTLSGNSAWAFLTCAILNVDSDSTISSATSTGGANANPDPPNLSANGDLWAAVAQHENRTFSVFSTNYTHRQEQNTGTGADIAIIFRQLIATSENPSAWTGSGSSFWTAATMAIGKANPRFLIAQWIG